MEDQEKPAPDSFSRDTLEFPAVLELLRRHFSGPLAVPLLARIEPGTKLEAIREEHEFVREALEFLRTDSRPSFSELKDPREILARLAVEGQSCSGAEILDILALVRAAEEIRALFTKTALRRLGEESRALADFRALAKTFEGRILPDGSLDSSASPELKRVRQSIQHTRDEVQALLERLVRRLEAERVLQDSVVTLRNDRFVLPVKAEEKRRVQGVVHGVSSSGASVFVEPLETLPLNNELVELQEREFAEIQRILAAWSDLLREHFGELQQAVETLSRFDLAFAKAEFARAYNACLPEFHAQVAIGLKEARHPLLEAALGAKRQRPVPVTVELGETKKLMVISGPNAGGKTVTLKTVGLAVLMAQAGLPVLASESRLPLFRRVLADIGDRQSIEASLSTFSAHVVNIQSMAAMAGGDDLVLLDELGASTEPNEGAALAVAVLEYFRHRRAMTIATTHHSRLKGYAASTPEAVNAAMEFDERTLAPTYRLLIGVPGKSSGIEIAERLGLDSSIVAQARELLHPADTEAATLVASLHARRAELETELAQIRRERQELAQERARLDEVAARERRAKLSELDKRLEETIRQLEKRWDRIVEELRASGVAAKTEERAKRKAVSLEATAREQWNAEVLEALGQASPEEPASARALAVGSAVRVRDISTPGTVIALNGEEAEVEVGRLRMRVPASELRALPSPASERQPEAGAGRAASAHASLRSGAPRFVAPEAAATGEGLAAEINVIGATAEEARERVDKFLDEAYVAGRLRLRIVHGHGKGILKKALEEMFAAHPHVEKFYPAPPREGGAGATIVELKM